ncbi:uncharacterized protein DDB_G0271670-like [Aplysia californica]|uniref:Uncharacterized protein DDB_G0271670-like n=1 Tax=Aplysia californica TaxID=6500 RepID=A0ABM1A592_APLCA|nr:uncharacterized protein DDB_G0271670-like [Aplysia californica]
MRQRANRHHFAPSHRLSSAAMTPVTMTFFHDDPPPPYHPTNPNTAINSNGTGRAKRRPIFYKFLNFFRTSGNSAMRTDANNTHAGNDVVSRNRHGVGSGARSSTDSTLNLINSRISFTDVLRANSEAGEVIMDNPLRASVSNDYQELPDVSTIRSAPRREAEVVDDNEGSIFDDIIEDSNYNDGVVDDDNNPPGEVRNPDTDSDRDEREERQPHTTLTTNGFLGRHGNSPLPPLPPSTLPPSLSSAQSTSLFPHAPSPPPARNANIVSNENDVMNSGSVPSNEASPCFNGTTNGVAQSGVLDNHTMKVKSFSQQSSVEVRNSRDACLSRPSLPVPRSSLPSSSSSSRSSNQEANNGRSTSSGDNAHRHQIVTPMASVDEDGYQIPHLVRIYDRPDQNQEEHDPVYHSLKFHKESS